MNEELKLSDFNFELPNELIATEPASPRDVAKLLVVNDKNLKDDYFYNLDNYFKEGDVFVLNNTKVFPSRLFGKTEDGKQIEVFILEEKEESECLVKPGKKIKEKVELFFSDKLIGFVFKNVIPTQEGSLPARIGRGGDSSLPRNPSERAYVRADDKFSIKFNLKGEELRREIKKIGEMPLPPYILKERANKHAIKEDVTEYQTIFAKEEGSVAAPTAGLHFTKELLEKIRAKGVIITEVTLHVGLGTFEPIREENFLDHKMHSEQYFISGESANILNKAKEENRRIIACGTTTTRVLESTIKNDRFAQTSGSTSIFIYPGYQFKAIDGMITNFHLPKSSLLLLVSAFSGITEIRNAYEHAIKNNYRFYSYGDGMILLN